MTTNNHPPKGGRLPVRAYDNLGNPIVRVPLAQGGHAQLDAEDFDTLTASGFSDQWTVNLSGSGHSYVRVRLSNTPGNLGTVARLIMCPGAGRVVKYRDRNPTNLRRKNLYFAGGTAKGCEGDAAPQDEGDF